MKTLMVLTFVMITLNFTPCRCQVTSSGGVENLRSDYKKVSKDNAKRMLRQKGLFDKYWNKSGGFKNEFESMSVGREKVIIDHMTRLMWHPSGSFKMMNLKEARQWIVDLNKKCYAGYFDWRLPTLEEAASLLENSRQKNLYIDRAFDRRQWCIWTGNTLSPHLAWFVVFSGRIGWFEKNVRMNYVRPVRSLSKS